MSEQIEKLQEKILQRLDKVDEVNTLDLSKHLDEDHQKIVGAINSLQFIGNLVESTLVSSNKLELTDEGKFMAKNGSYEANLYHAIPADEGIKQADLMKLLNAKIGFSQAMSARWIMIDKSGTGPPIVKRLVSEIVDNVQMYLQHIEKGDLSEVNDKIKQQLNSRKLIKNVIVKSFVLKKGPEFTTTVDKMETDLTTEMLSTGRWENVKFKDYNFKALGAVPESGFLHPLLKVRSEMRQIFLEMGFAEMPTSQYVESSFWNFDALFQPQQHPARDAHDTFFVTQPKSAKNFPMDYLERVKTVHSVGGYGSVGYGYDWKIEEAQKNLLRTHTTAISARMLYEIAQQNEFKPTRLFSIDRVFRNETLDATHLAEFFQVEGVIADYGLTLGDLIGTFTEFFRKLGITQLEFKPAYNPYTEPSMEIFCFHPGLGRWIEIGNSGMFRPEMLLPMGLPDGVRVLAWGLSLERPTMIKFGYNNIRDLVGPRVDLHMVQSTPLCRLDK